MNVILLALQVPFVITWEESVNVNLMWEAEGVIVVMLDSMDLVQRGAKVCVTKHSTSN